MSDNLKITLKKSMIGRDPKHRKVLVGLGLTRTGMTVVRKDTPEIRGMLNKVSFMVSVEGE